MRLVAGRGFAVELHREEVANREHRSGKDAAGWGARYFIQQRRHVQKAFLQKSNC